MITPKEAATLVDWPNPSRKQELHDFVLNASAKEIQMFFHCLDMDAPTTYSREWQSRARMALDIRLVEDADISTRRIVWLTRFVAILTVVLVVLTAVLVFFTFKLAYHP